ncbi:BaiN/RdsA family NAD(P)/FAD-dependent oxidoreductase [Spongiivirga citrea]|uniref:Aminoacetone oxidase family FAD-binding enzyme n=1 Tax=Spongiivirga citrea TaxID=1481457 RepID=A0A6M0CSU6_9FLAO|nr:NAD(P)/FAD-dependent oxidoreductase [Spongiivirga citrea]NER16910.1 aminoacetone oxidase family FAD-binding enzyme [Spongiivirga citrea]
MNFDIVIVGGGAAGFFAAIHSARFNPSLKIAILERGTDVLTKVKVSGGGRCNVTHAEFDPKELTTFYPRGEKELLGPFHTFCSGDTMTFFDELGVELKIEDDGRIFPVSNNSQTIIDALLSEVKRLNVPVLTGQSVKQLQVENDIWHIQTKKSTFQARKVLIAVGSNPKIWDLLAKLGHTIIKPVPSLFTFNIKDERIEGLAGLATQAEVEVLANGSLFADGPLLITHWGLSGPAILKLSAWGARILNELAYKFTIQVNFIPDESIASVERRFDAMRKEKGKQRIVATPLFNLPKRLWQRLVIFSEIDENLKWADLSKVKREVLINSLQFAQFQVDGKSTFKEEFVTAGGVDLKEINFKTYESKKLPNLFFAGEVLNVDAITGGFNFQNAWTSGYIAAKEMAN